MFDVVSKYKSDNMFFAGLKPGGDHYVYLSAYGRLASVLLEKYVEDQRADDEEVFTEWDKSLDKAASQVGFSASHEIEDGHVYITSFQSGIGVSEEEDED